MKFQKKPVVIEAIQFTGENAFDIFNFMGRTRDIIDGELQQRDHLVIHTLEGNMECMPGDWVIKGVKGEFYPCKPDIFEATYKAASECTLDPWAIIEELQGQIAAEIRVMLGEGPYSEKKFDAEQRQRRIKAMQTCAALSTSDAERHEAWMKMHLDAGWAYGVEFDPDNKLHPNLLPWDQLPASTRSKAKIFDLCAKAAAKLAG